MGASGSTAELEPGQHGAPRWVGAAVGAACLVSLAWLLVWVLRSDAPDRRRVIAPAGGDASLADRTYAGARACAECHPGEAASHSRTGHARTLRQAGAIDLAGWLDGRRVADPERPGVSWTYRRDGDRLFVERVEGSAIERLPIEFALGSGTRAVTFVTLQAGPDGRPAGLEHRLTYFAHDQSLGLTPGQTRDIPGRTPNGFRLPPEVTADCFGCHATRTTRRGRIELDRSALIPNVQCERCHGPGAAHVAAARRGDSDLRMPMGPESLSAAEELRACGRCHRVPEMVDPRAIRPDNAALARFPGVGLVQTACYQRSAGALRCTTCHDPHNRASVDRDRSEASCRSCHVGAPRAVCPVAPRGGCLDCHMPKRDANHGLLFSDHWIRRGTIE
jgi:hypothetical protein